MTQPQKNTALALAVVAGVISLPLPWMTLHGATIQGDLGDTFQSMFGQVTVVVTGLNGHVTFLFQTPIWFIVGVAIAANVLQLMRNSKMFAIPSAAEWVVAIVAATWVALPVIAALFSGKATLGIGSLLGLAAAVIPLVCLIIPLSPRHVPTSDSELLDIRAPKHGDVREE